MANQIGTFQIRHQLRFEDGSLYAVTWLLGVILYDDGTTAVQVPSPRNVAVSSNYPTRQYGHEFYFHFKNIADQTLFDQYFGSLSAKYNFTISGANASSGEIIIPYSDLSGLSVGDSLGSAGLTGGTTLGASTLSATVVADNFECPNQPNGAAVIAMIGIDGNGQHVSELKPFNFTSGSSEVDFSGLIPQMENGIAGYVIRAPKGFTDGVVVISEIWYTSFGAFEHVRNIYEIVVTNSDQQGSVMIPHWIYALDGAAGLGLPVGVPVFFSGRVSLSCNFSSLPDCLPAVTPDPDEGYTAEELDGFIAEQPIVYPSEPKPPLPPDQPAPPDGIDPPDEIDEPLPHEPVTGGGGGTPPQPPESGCECEIYLADKIYAGLLDIRKGFVDHANVLDIRLRDSTDLILQRLLSFETRFNLQMDLLNSQLYQLIAWAINTLYPEVKLTREALEDIKSALILDNGKTIAEILQEFVENYEPVSIENEYRVASHRVIENLDAEMNRL